MKKNKRNQILIISTVVVLIIIAWLCRIQRDGNIKGWIRCLIQCGLLLGWSISIRKRIISNKVLEYLLSIAALFGFWLIDRTVKYTMLTNHETLTRYAWYLYYIPQLLLPVFLLFSAFYLRKSDKYKLPKVCNLLFIPAIIGIALVLTNDLHQMVFSFPNGIPNEGNSYSHEAMYYVIMALYSLEIVAFFIILIKKCRLSKKGKLIILPIIPIFLLIVYGAVYIINYDLVAVPLGDMTAVNCCLAILSLESCIYKGLIPSNTHYDALLKASFLPTLITDSSLAPSFSSETKIAADDSLLKQAIELDSITKQGKRISAYSIEKGYAFWQEDISELIEIAEELKDLQNELSQQYMVEQETYKTTYKRQALIEKNHLYNLMQSETAERVATLSELVSKLSIASRESEIHTLIAEIALRLAYLKRRNNLLFIKQDNNTINYKELIYCINESLNNFKLSNATVNMNYCLSRSLSFENTTRLYDSLENALELALYNTSDIFVTLNEDNNNNKIYLRINLFCTANMISLEESGFIVDEDSKNDWTLEYYVIEGGEVI